MSIENQSHEFQAIAGYGLGAILGVLALVYGQCLYTAVSIIQPSLF